MAAPKNNQFWKQRSKHGRDKLFSSPELLWEEACKYFEWCDKNPLQSVEIHGKNSIECIVPKMRAYTWSGLEYFLDIHSLRDYKTKEEYKDFSQVITRIEKVIYTQKFEGAAAGLLQHNIIARDLGLTEKMDTKVDAKVNGEFKQAVTVTVIKSDVPIANSEKEIVP
jgi:DNA-packaging protein gp3